MIKDDLNKAKERISSLIEELQDSIQYLKEETKPVEPSCALGCITRMDAIGDKGVNEALLKSSRERLVRLENALKRIDYGTYGKCIRCGKEIPPGRLEAVPEALVCVSCADRSSR